MRLATHLGWHPPTTETLDDVRLAASLRSLTDRRLVALGRARASLEAARQGREGVWALQAYVQAGHRAAELLRAQARCAEARALLDECLEAAIAVLDDTGAPHELRLFGVEAVRWSTAELVGIDRDHGDLASAERVAERARGALMRFRDAQVHA